MKSRKSNQNNKRRKKTGSTLFTLGLIICLMMGTGMVSYGANDGSAGYIRVGIKTVNQASKVGTITATEDLAVFEYGKETMNQVVSFPGVKSLKVSMNGGKITLSLQGTADSGEAANVNDPPNTQGGEALLPYTYEATKEYTVMGISGAKGKVDLDGTSYRGGIMAKSPSGTRVSIVNVLDVEDYVKGVLPKEMPSSWPKEALKAQAISARNFANCSIGLHGSEGYDLCATTHCQVYAGLGAETTATNQAVDETKGVLMYYNGKPVNAFYHKNNGGYTDKAEDVWGGTAGYIVSKKDPYSPDYSWSYEITYEKCKSVLASAGFKVGDVTGVKITQTVNSGSVLALEFTGTQGSATLKKEAIRSAFGYSQVKSLKFTLNNESVSDTGGGTSGTAGGGPFYGIGSATGEKIVLADLFVLDGEGSKGKLSSSLDVYAMGMGATVKIQDKNNLATEKSSSNGKGIVFTGKGYGHGIGLSQDGAKVMAEKGFTYLEILNHYYTNIEVH